MSLVGHRFKSLSYIGSCLALTFGLALSVPEIAQASRKVPKCADAASVAKSKARNTKAITKYQELLKLDEQWEASSKAACTNSPTTPTTPTVACRTTQQPKVLVRENGVCFQYTEAYFTCEKDFNSFSLGGSEESYRGKNGDKWQINFRSPRADSFAGCPAQ